MSIILTTGLLYSAMPCYATLLLCYATIKNVILYCTMLCYSMLYCTYTRLSYTTLCFWLDKMYFTRYTTIILHYIKSSNSGPPYWYYVMLQSAMLCLTMIYCTTVPDYINYHPTILYDFMLYCAMQWYGVPDHTQERALIWVRLQTNLTDETQNMWHSMWCIFIVHVHLN